MMTLSRSSIRIVSFVFIFLLFSCSKEVIDDTIPPTTVELTDWSKSSYQTFDIRYPLNSSNLIEYSDSWSYGYLYGGNSITVDYNNDGYDDLVSFKGEFASATDQPAGYTGYEKKNLIKFKKGNKDGTLSVDELNNDKFLGLVHGRKILLGDFNKDNYVDLFLIGHGYDKQPFPGEFPKVLMSDGSGGFLETDYTNLVSFYHGGSSGDIDNDGDLDVVLVDAGRGNSVIFENINGRLYPHTDRIDNNDMNQQYNSELFDIDNDGFLDLIVGGHDWLYNSLEYNNTPLIIYGDGFDFNTNNRKSRLPASSIRGQGIVTNFEFIDLDDDGVVEILLTRTGDNITSNSNFYKGWSIQILKLANDSYLDYTEQFIDVYSGSGQWIVWTKLKDVDNDGKLELFNSVNPYRNSSNYHEWELINGKFIKK